MSQGTLYLYFTTKDDIILALAEDRHQSEAFLDALAMSEQDPVQGLLTLIELHGRGLDDAQRMDARRVGVQGWAEALRSAAIHDSVVGGIARVRVGIVRLIERGQASGQIRPEVEPDAVARMLIAVFQGFVLQAAWGEPLDLPACGRTIRDMICAMLTPMGRETYSTEFMNLPPRER